MWPPMWSSSRTSIIATEEEVEGLRRIEESRSRDIRWSVAVLLEEIDGVFGGGEEGGWCKSCGEGVWVDGTNK